MVSVLFQSFLFQCLSLSAMNSLPALLLLSLLNCSQSDESDLKECSKPNQAYHDPESSSAVCAVGCKAGIFLVSLR